MGGCLLSVGLGIVLWLAAVLIVWAAMSGCAG